MQFERYAPQRFRSRPAFRPRSSRARFRATPSVGRRELAPLYANTIGDLRLSARGDFHGEGERVRILLHVGMTLLHHLPITADGLDVFHLGEGVLVIAKSDLPFGFGRT